MAEALISAPKAKEEKKWVLEEQYLNMEFDTDKRYVFQLAKQNLERELPIMEVIGNRSIPLKHKPFKPWQNIVYTSQIIWKGTRRIVRYYDGCDSIFADEQSKDKDTIQDFMRSTRLRNFLDGNFSCGGDEKWLLRYMHIASWNAESPFRTKAADSIWIPLDTVKVVTEETARLDRIDEALRLAKEATPRKMMIHAAYLGIGFKDPESDNDLTDAEIRVAYRKKAIKDSEGFITSYGNTKIELRYYIGKAMESHVIKPGENRNKLVWANSGSEICDISGITTMEGMQQKAFEFAQMEQGEEFLLQLKALYEQ